MTPEDRPSFKELDSSVSKWLECIAGYLQFEFNPFTGTGGKRDGEEEEEEEEEEDEEEEEEEEEEKEKGDSSRVI